MTSPRQRPGPRLELISAEVDRDASSQVQVVVTLSLSGREHRGEAEGVGSDLYVLRLAARATIRAVEAVLARSDYLRLVGVKRVRAFDADVALAAVRVSDDPSRQLLGAVPIDDRLVRSGVTATLDAVNRVLGPELEKLG